MAKPAREQHTMAPDSGPASHVSSHQAASNARRSSAGVAARFLVAALLGLAIGPPMLVAGVGCWIEHERAQLSAQALAFLVQRDLAAAGASPSITELAARVGGAREGSVNEASTIGVAGQDAVRLHGHRDGLTAPRVGGSREIVSAEGGTLRIEVERSVAGELVAAALCALISCASALLLWHKALRRPLDTLQRAESLLGALSRRDALTGLHNRNGLRLRLARALERSRATRRGVAVLLIDVDRFRLINQSLGHPIGDQLLCAVADRIRSVTRMDDVVARLGGDQFAVLVEGAAQAQVAQAMARNLLRACEAPHLLDGQETVAPLSIGIALAGEVTAGVDELLTCAETAARAAKAAGGGRACTFDAAMQTHSEEQLTVERELRQALLEQQFGLVFQPIADLSNGRIVGVEALV
ncbi:MAG TPA: diguanylate cyclase, partial [Burkholderiaceae bacterium]|nr:diguanylate cyclase [Burkholderiaceae bacterium]